MNQSREIIEILETADTESVQAFYEKVGYGGGVQAQDRVLVAMVEGSVAAVVRLCPEEGTMVLRGMYVAEELRGQGIGTRMLEAVAGVIGTHECWCIPFAHLTEFYSRIGFQGADSIAAPGFLDERLKRYTAAGRDVVVMVRPAG